MNKTKTIYDSLKEYGESDYYPMHMPGHKRRGFNHVSPYDIDITEIDGFDNLHDAKGILKASQERASKLYNSDKSYYLVNGSSCGILAAICGSSSENDGILVARNCHRSVYNGIQLNKLKPLYIYPETLDNIGICGGIDPEVIKNELESHPDISTVIVTSPSYEGLVSDIKRIAEIVHEKNGILIVDEAHGAHFHFESHFPESALDLGADIVIQSAHKTLPAFTQSAFLHLKGTRVDIARIEMYLKIFQSSSPSYILMAGLDRCVNYLENEGQQDFKDYVKRLINVRRTLESQLKRLHLLNYQDLEIEGIAGKKDRGRAAFDLDMGKLVITTNACNLTGSSLYDILRNKYHLQCEMAGENHIIAMTSVMDSEEGLIRFQNALIEIDKSAEIKSTEEAGDNKSFSAKKSLPLAQVALGIKQALDRPYKEEKLKDCIGEIAREFVYVYPPGIPIIAPGEIITEEVYDRLMELKASGLSLTGADNIENEMLKIVI